MDKQSVLREINAIYENCKAHMKDVPQDWQKVYDALNRVCEKYGNAPYVVKSALKAYDALEHYWRSAA